MMKFYDMKDRPLAFDVFNTNGKVAIPAGTFNVKIAFKQSSLVRDVDGNVYKSDIVPYGGKRLNVISIMDLSITDRSNFNLIEELFFHFGVEVLL